MTNLETIPLVGRPLNRVDGPLKVTGGARYPSDFSFPNLVHAVLVQSTVAAGRIRRITTEVAKAVPGVLAVITYENAPKLARGPKTDLGAAPPPPLRGDRILHYGQHIAVVVAETLEQATAAAHLIEVDYEATAEPLLDINDQRAERLTNPWMTDMKRGDVAAGLESADVQVEANYTTPGETNNPLGLFATVAVWDGDSLNVYDTTQWPYNVRATLAENFGVPENGVRIRAPFVGGGFGAGLRAWPNVTLCALAARHVKRPVKLVLTRPQMFTSVGHRPETVHHIKIGAKRNGEFVAIEHEGIAPVALEDDNLEPVTFGTASSYACPNLATRDQQVRLNIPCPGSMRAPGEAQGNFALESAIDELSYTLRLDPLDLRLRNYAETHPQTSLPWSSKALRACYEKGVERFGWSRRNPEPRSMRTGRWLIGYGMAGVSYNFYRAACKAKASIGLDGRAFVRSAATDIGTGTYTIMTQLVTEILGLEIDRVRFDLGDTDMPMSPQAGGSGLTGALGTAVHAACVQLVQAFLDQVRNDADSPLRGCGLEDVTVVGGRIQRTDDPKRAEAYTDILARHGLDELAADGDSAPPSDLTIQGVASFAARFGRFVRVLARATGAQAPAGAFGAKFVEVHVDPDLGRVRVARVVSAIDGGRILNEKTATSQIIGGTVGGIGMALLEETVTDPRTGRIVNASLGDYLVPVNADVPDMDVIFVGEPDPMNPIGVKGVGEIGLVGIGAAIANAVYHATGNRVRSLPITPDKVLGIT